MASEGDEWKKYRKITAPAFSDVSYCYFSDFMLSETLHLEKQQVSVEGDCENYGFSVQRRLERQESYFYGPLRRLDIASA